MFFVSNKEEAGANALFKKNCTYHGLDVHVSLKALTALKSVIDAKNKNEVADIGERDTYTLARRGLVRVTNDGEVLVTNLGLLVAALAEAGGLIVLRQAPQQKVTKVKT